MTSRRMPLIGQKMLADPKHLELVFYFDSPSKQAVNDTVCFDTVSNIMLECLHYAWEGWRLKIEEHEPY
jgi:hypothetical protein